MSISKYLEGRRKTISSSIAAEALAGNEFKLACEKTALAEITAMESFLIESRYSTPQSKDEQRADNSASTKLLDELDCLVDTIGISMELGNKRAHEIIQQLRT